MAREWLLCFSEQAWPHLYCLPWMMQGPHLLAPTGSDLGRHTQVGKVLAGYHSDLNFLTIHGRCRLVGPSCGRCFVCPHDVGDHACEPSSRLSKCVKGF